jgi:hypothetical protein
MSVIDMSPGDKKIFVIHSILFTISVVCTLFVHIGFLALMGCSLGFITGTLIRHGHYILTSKKIILIVFCIAVFAVGISFLLYLYSFLWVIIINSIALFIATYLLLRSLKKK